MRAYRRARALVPADTPIFKRCGKCEDLKAHEEFSRCRYQRDGLMGWCKLCYRTYYNQTIKPRRAARRAARL
jgi:hypothetical protein